MTRPTPEQLTSALASWLGVILAGLATTGISLFAVSLYTERNHEDPMAVYIYYVLPVGAIIVGIVSGLGYWIAAWYSGARPSKTALWLICILQIVAYFVARYLQFRTHHYVYRGTDTPVSFWYHFHLSAMSYVFQSSRKAPVSLGALGYLLRAWEIALFVLGGVLIPATLAKQPYCAKCQAYLKEKELALIPAEELLPDADAIDSSELPKAIDDAGKTAFDALATIAEAGNVTVFLDQIKPFPPRRLRNNLPSRLEIAARYCPICFNGRLRGKTIIVRSISRSVSSHSRQVPADFIVGIR